MAHIRTQRILYAALRDFGRDYDALMVQTAAEISAVINRYATADNGTRVPPSMADTVAGQGAAILERKFTLSEKRVFGADGVTALTPFAELMNKWLAIVTYQVVDATARFMEKKLPDDLIAWLKTGHEPAQAEQISISNFTAQYDAPHTWVDPNGYTLSRRIWRNSQEMRLALDQMLTDAILSGTSALDLSRQVEQFLRPYTRLARQRSNKPYGVNVSYPAMRLARTEITRAHGAATLAAAGANPFVSGIDWALSVSHPRTDICDDLATIGMSGERKKEPYSLNGVPGYPAHPQCLCNLRQAVTERADDVVKYLRSWLNENRPAPLTALNKKRFVESLLGYYLTNMAELYLL